MLPYEAPTSSAELVGKTGNVGGQTGSPACIHRHRQWVNGVRLHYLDAGTGEMIMLLHGWPQTSHAWRKLIPLLAKQFRVIAPDLRGIGDSSKPQDGYDKKMVAADVHGLVRSLGVDRILLVGHDMGGQVGYAYAAQWPDEVRKFVFIESGLPAFGQEEAMDVGKGGSWHFGFNMQSDLAVALVSGRERMFLEYVLRRDTVGAVDPSSISDADLDVYANAWRRPGALRSSFAYYRELRTDAEDNRRFGAVKLPMPVLAIGAEDGYGEASATTIAKVAGDVTSVMIPRSGHYVAEEQPDALASALRHFFTS